VDGLCYAGPVATSTISVGNSSTENHGLVIGLAIWASLATLSTSKPLLIKSL